MDEDALVFEQQLGTIRDWANATVGIVVALYEPNLSEEQYDIKCEEIGKLIQDRVVGNRRASSRVIVYDDKSLKDVYRRIVEATLRWAGERINSDE